MHHAASERARVVECVSHPTVPPSSAAFPPGAGLWTLEEEAFEQLLTPIEEFGLNADSCSLTEEECMMQESLPTIDVARLRSVEGLCLHTKLPAFAAFKVNQMHGYLKSMISGMKVANDVKMVLTGYIHRCMCHLSRRLHLMIKEANGATMLVEGRRLTPFDVSRLMDIKDDCLGKYSDCIEYRIDRVVVRAYRLGKILHSGNICGVHYDSYDATLFVKQIVCRHIGYLIQWAIGKAETKCTRIIVLRHLRGAHSLFEEVPLDVDDVAVLESYRTVAMNCDRALSRSEHAKKRGRDSHGKFTSRAFVEKDLSL